MPKAWTDVYGEFMNKKLIYESFSDVADYIYLEHEVTDKTWISRAHYHNSIEFSVCLGGTHRICVNGNMYTIERGDILFINSYGVHYFDIREGTETVAILIGENYLDDLRRASGAEEINFPILMQDKQRNARAIEFLLQWSKDKPNCSILQHQGYSNLFLGELYKEYGWVKPMQGKASHVVIDAMQYIQKNLKNEITVEAMARRVGYSKNHFAKLFHETVGQTFRDYVNMQRAEMAKDMIENDASRTIVDISFACGFESMATFYRAYEKRFGESPRQVAGGGGTSFTH